MPRQRCCSLQMPILMLMIRQTLFHPRLLTESTALGTHTHMQSKSHKGLMLMTSKDASSFSWPHVLPIAGGKQQELTFSDVIQFFRQMFGLPFAAPELISSLSVCARPSACRSERSVIGKDPLDQSESIDGIGKTRKVFLVYLICWCDKRTFCICCMIDRCVCLWCKLLAEKLSIRAAKNGQETVV